MNLEVLNAVTIYELNGAKYTGPRQVYIKKHSRFLTFVRLSIDGQEYSLVADDLLCAIERTIAQVPAREAESTVAAEHDPILDPRPL